MSQQEAGSETNAEEAVVMEAVAGEPSPAKADKPASEAASTEKKKAQKRKPSSSDEPTRPKKKKVKDDNAPKQPLNGYVRFLARNRERVREANPEASFPDVTKLLAKEWTEMPTEQKQVYLDEAEQDKIRYNRELEQYKNSESYRLFQERTKETEAKSEANTGKSGGKGATKAEKKDKATGGGGDKPDKENTVGRDSTDIPIFTEDFLEHNRAREAELRQLRKLNTEYEEQNAILSKHIENMRAAVEKLHGESNQYVAHVERIETHLGALSAYLMEKFEAIPDPVTGEYPSKENMIPYLQNLKNSPKDISSEIQSIVSDINSDDFM